MLPSISWMTSADSTSAHFGAIGTNQLCFAASAAAALPSIAAALSSRLVALGSAPFAIRASCDLVSVKILIHWAARSLFWLLPTTARFEPPRKDGISGIAAVATLPATLVLTFSESGLFGSFGCSCAEPASHVAPYIMPLWPCAKIAAWSTSFLVLSPTEYFLTRSPHLVRPSCAAGSDSVPTHLPPSCLAIWPPEPYTQARPAYWCLPGM